jgi:hypothetical protein
MFCFKRRKPLARDVAPAQTAMLPTAPALARLPALCRGWPASGPGRLPPGLWFLTGASAEAASVKRDFACAFNGCLVLCSLPYGHSHA